VTYVEIREGEVYKFRGPKGEIIERTVLKIGEPRKDMMWIRKHEDGKEVNVLIYVFEKYFRQCGVA